MEVDNVCYGYYVTALSHSLSPVSARDLLRTSAFGGLAGTRTRDRRLKRPLLYQLSYQPDG